MKFLSRSLVQFSAIVTAIASLFFYSVKALSFNYPETDPAPLLYVIYIFIVFITAILFIRKEEGHAYLGTNYHLVGFVITNAMPMLLSLVGFFPRVTITNVLWIMLFWGVFLVFHFTVYQLFFRKKMIGNYAKDDVFM